MGEKHPFLWEIKVPGNTLTSYIFGTMHIAEGKDIDYLEKIKSLIDQCSLFANEMDLGQSHLMDPNSFQSNIHLRDQISDKLYHKIATIFRKSFGIELDVVGNLKPLIITNMLAEIILGKSGCVGLDRYLYDYAKSKEISTTGIEHTWEQTAIMEAIPTEYQLKALLGIAKNVSKFRDSIIGLNHLYQTGEIAILHKKAKRSLGKMRGPLLYDRNVKMAQRIADMVQNQTAFITVGAGHLYGSKGVLRLLKKHGCQIRMVRSTMI